MDNSKRLVVKGVFWNGVQLVVNQSFAFIVKLVLARLLLPEQFGLIGMATVFTGFVQAMTELGIGAALVQKKEEDLTPAHYQTAFWTGIVWSSFLFLVMCFITGPLVANFYKQDILKSLIPVISIGILLTPINLVNKAQLTKKMDFKKIARIEGLSSIVAGSISILLAFWGAGVWSLAAVSTISVLFAIPFYFNATRWTPKFVWSRRAFKDIFGFGIFTTGTNLINYIIENVDYLLIGKLLSAQLLGAYSFAFVLTDTFRSRLMSVINTVMYPLYGKKQSEPEAVKRYYLKVVNYNCIIVFPIMIILFTVAEPFLFNFFGEKWSSSVLPLKILSMAIMVQMFTNSNTVLIRALGRPGLEMRLQLIKAVIFIPTIAYGIWAGGIVGAAWAVLFNKFFTVLVAQYAFSYLLSIKISASELYQEVKPAVMASVIAYAIGYLLLEILHVHFIFVGMSMALVFAIVAYKLIGPEIIMQMKVIKQQQ